MVTLIKKKKKKSVGTHVSEAALRRSQWTDLTKPRHTDPALVDAQINS